MTKGTYVGSDGKRRPKVFWLGHDRDKALLKKWKIEWHSWVAAAQGGWTPEYISQMESRDTIALVRERYFDAERLRQMLTPHLAPAQIVQLPAPGAAVDAATPLNTPSGIPMFHTSLDDFVKNVQQQNVSISHRKSAGDSIKAIKHYQADCPLSCIDYAWLENLTNSIKARPLSRKKDSRTGKHMPINPITVKRLLTYLRMAIQWVDRQHQSNRFGGWRAPSEWRDLCKVELRKLMSKPERDKAANGPDQLTIDEIKRLYHAACASRSKSHPILFLLGLFAGLGQTELSTVRREEFDLDLATLTHRRNKTSQKGVYWLPPELVKMLRDHFRANTVKPDDLAFKTRDGLPLVTIASDSVRQAWDDWRKRAGVDRHNMGFYCLRRFFGDYATRVGGDAVGEAALAHTPKSVRAKHYSGYRDFDMVRKAGQQLHAELLAAGMFAGKAKEAGESGNPAPADGEASPAAR